MKYTILGGFLVAAALAGCSSGTGTVSQTDPDITIPGGNPYQSSRMSGQGDDPSPILTPNEENQDKVEASP
jgi:hypothetical protein